MNTTGHPASDLGAVRDLDAVGVPGAEGRWQPSRAGMVNSWAWSNEVLVFADGWMTLTGPNGSGKSLTASMLVTLLLDGDTSQTALSVSGKAAGTLTSRHTDRNDREDRTGTWWLEYGLVDTKSGGTSYLTTGLWLRSVSGNLQRAFFICPGRVTEQLLLERDGNPIRIDDLAAQLAAAGGELFTSVAALRSKAAAHLGAVSDETGYRHAVRTRLLAPLDEVQFEALMGVLRSLRSLRTAEAIPPAQMRAVLTEALPALDPDRLNVIAEAMERISELETQLADMRDEAKQLATTDRRYQRYVEAVVEVEAAHLTAANTEFDAQTRRTREATTRLETARGEQVEAAAQLKSLHARISALEGRREAADTALRDHAGAELPHMERRATELAQEAERALIRADGAAGEATIAADQSTEASMIAEEGSAHLATLSEELHAAARSVGADAALDSLVAATASLIIGAGAEVTAIDVEQTCATPLAWVEARTAKVAYVDLALQAHAEAQHNERFAADVVRRAERHEDACRVRADETSRARQNSEALLVEAIVEWDARAQYLRGVPPELIESDDSAGNRLALDRVAEWLSSAAAAARSRIDVIGLRQAATTAAALAHEADRSHRKAVGDHDIAVAAAVAAEHALAEERERARVEDLAAETARKVADDAHLREISAARHDLEVAEQDALDGEASARQTATRWIERTHQWRDGLRFLTGVALPALDEHGVDPLAVRMAVDQEHTRIGLALDRLADAAEREVNDTEAIMAEVEVQLTEARHAAPVPTPAPWRVRLPEQGVPFWALVDFAEHLSAVETDRLEGALLVAGLLDALVTNDGSALAGDLVITATRPAPGHTLADLLRPESSPVVPTASVQALLRSIPVDEGIGSGRFSTGVLTSAAPDVYRAKFIGRTARERARLKRVADLETELNTARGQRDAAESRLQTRKADVLSAVSERDSLPTSADLAVARQEAALRRSAAEQARQDTAGRVSRSELAKQRTIAQLDTATARRAAEVAAVEQRARHARETSTQAGGKADEAGRVAEERTGVMVETAEALAEATQAQGEADDERTSFPPTSDARRAQRTEDAREDDLRRAATDVITAAEGHQEASDAVREALRGLNQTATLPDGTLLPTDRSALSLHGATAVRLGHQVELWGQAAKRTMGLARHARAAARTEVLRAALSTKANAEAEEARLTAIREASAVAEARELYGAEYELLRRTKLQITDELVGAKEEAVTAVDLGQEAREIAAAAQTTLDEIAPHREAAERRRDERFKQLGNLVTEGFTSVPDDLPRTAAGKPAHLTAALQWARRLLAAHTGGTDRRGALIQTRDRALAQLETSARSTSSALARFDRQVMLVGVEDSEWRRAVVADPGASRGEDLHAAVVKLETTAAQLEDDLREDVKRTLKTSLFTQLRRDILVRRETAQELVRHIRATLAGVRTGVANVGVQVEWTVREDEDAQRMVELISKPQSDEIFEDMYAVLRQRMEEKSGDSWKERVAHTFDYRSWHDWRISVTHASFHDQNQEKFREVTARSNPLETLSTGERRLATMLPLLAAAWSMYSGRDYRGPRWVSIDEIDAAFDEPNLRQVLALLRSWEFDVLATAPFITPMIKKEAGRVVLHQVVTAGQRRVTVPWLWKGHGEPDVLMLDLTIDEVGA